MGEDMDSEKLSLNLSEFEKNLSHSFIQLREETDFFDVTLIADDETQIQAHKVVLSSCSGFFKSILKTNPHSHPLLYLSGVTSENLAFVLDYIYSGEVQISKDSLSEFMKVAQKLKLKELKVDIDDEDNYDYIVEDEDEVEDHTDDITVEEDTASPSNAFKVEEDPIPVEVKEPSNPEPYHPTPEEMDSCNLLKEDGNTKSLTSLPKEEAISNLVYEELKEEDNDDFEDFDDDEYEFYDDNPLPEHRFIVRRTLKKGVPHTNVSLCIENRIYRRRNTGSRNGIINFSCNACEKYKKYIYASAKLVNNEYKLINAKDHDKHICNSPTVGIKITTKFMKDKIVEEPNRSFADIYKEVLENYTENMDPEEKESFMKTFPPLKNILPTLYRTRKKIRNIADGTSENKKKPDQYFYPKDAPLPEHRFQFKHHIGRQGPNAGMQSTKVSLFIGNRIFRRRNNTRRGDNLTFSCVFCERKGKFVNAQVKVVNEEHTLSRAPRDEHHICAPKKHCVDVKIAMKQIHEKIMEDLSRSVGEIYREVKESYAQSLDPQKRETFLSEFPLFKNIEANLYRKRTAYRNTKEQEERVAEITSHYSPTFAPFFAL